MEKLIRGVIYDDVDVKSIKDEMFGLLHFEGENTITNYFAKDICESHGGNVSFDDAKLYLHNMSAISSLTRLDEETGKTSNLIIPKETLSSNLVKELEKVDLGKNLIDEYVDDFFMNYLGASKVEPEDFCKGEEECLLKHVDKQNENRGKYFLDGKEVSAEEMIEFMENEPQFADVVPFIKALNGKVSCF